MMSSCVIVGQLQTALVPDFLSEQVFDVLQDTFLPVKMACETVSPKAEARPNAGSKPVSAAGMGGPDSLPRNSDNINHTVLSWKVTCLFDRAALVL